MPDRNPGLHDLWRGYELQQRSHDLGKALRRVLASLLPADGSKTQGAWHLRVCGLGWGHRAGAPWFARAGIEGILPLERQAGVDLERLRQRYPRFLFLGHYDKMVMPKGEQAMREEFERLLPVMRQGGFLPSVDHQTPPGVSLENYRIYLKLYAEYVRQGLRRLGAGGRRCCEKRTATDRASRRWRPRP